jgi:hypothetical protein
VVHMVIDLVYLIYYNLKLLIARDTLRVLCYIFYWNSLFWIISMTSFKHN